MYRLSLRSRREVLHNFIPISKEAEKGVLRETSLHSVLEHNAHFKTESTRFFHLTVQSNPISQLLFPFYVNSFFINGKMESKPFKQLS